jgi:DNA-binding transcriptional MerR regulator
MHVDISAAKEPLFPEKEVAQMLGISPSYLRILRRQQRISCYRFGGRVLYGERHISEFKQNSEQRARAVAA